jgi:hypothetical protein
LILTATVAFVVFDFVRHPLPGPETGVAAPPEHQLVLWVAGVDTGSAPESVATAAAARLSHPWRPARSEVVRGGSAAVVAALLGRHRANGTDLLVVHAGTLADIERDSHDTALPTIAAEARRAARLLRASVPIGLLADDALVVAVADDSGIDSGNALVDALRDDPGGPIFGVTPDPWSKTALAALVHAARVNGDVRYRVVPTADAGVVARAGDISDLLVAPRSELHSLPFAHRLRIVAESDVGDLAADRAVHVARLGDLLGHDAAIAGAHRWIALVAPPGTNVKTARSLAKQVRRMTANGGWERELASLSLAPPADADPGAYLAAQEREEQALATAASHVGQRRSARR